MIKMNLIIKMTHDTVCEFCTFEFKLSKSFFDFCFFSIFLIGHALNFSFKRIWNKALTQNRPNIISFAVFKKI